jgi:hypothetical protein
MFAVRTSIFFEAAESMKINIKRQINLLADQSYQQGATAMSWQHLTEDVIRSKKQKQAEEVSAQAADSCRRQEGGFNSDWQLQ